MPNRHTVLLIVGLVTLVSSMGCSMGNLPPLSSQPTPPTNPISILFLITPPSSLAVSASVTVNAAVLNESNAQVAWSVTCGSTGACGSFSFSSTPNQGNNTYTAPSSIPSGIAVTVTATLMGDTTKSVSATITITPPQPIAVAFLAVPPASLQVNAQALLSAEITNDISANPQVKWAASCASSPCGSFNPTTTTNEAPTTYTAPSAIPSGNSVVVTATSLTDPTKSVSANVAVTKVAPTLANGTYVFQVSGPVGNGSNFVAGVITAGNGAITGGEQDFISYAVNQNGYLPLFDPIAGGSYKTTPDGNLQLTLTTTDFNVGYVGTETLNGVIVSSSKVLLTEVDGAIGSGTLELQTSTAAPSGGYAFSTFGLDLYGQPAGIGGILNVDSPGGISGTGSILDVNDDFTFSGAQSLAASKVSGPDSFCRVVFQLTPSTPSAFQSLYLAGYIVDSAHIRLVETSGDAFEGTLGGTALSQGTSQGNFSLASIAGSSYVFGASGEDRNGPLQAAGVFTANADGSLNGTLNWNDLTGKTVQSPIPFTGSYTVDPTGRVTVSNLSDGGTFTQLQFYLTGSGQGLLLSADTEDMIAGRALLQQTGPFSAASLNGSYGLSAIEVGSNLGALGANATVGQVTSSPGNGTDSLTGFVDFGNGAADSRVSGSVTGASSGIFTGILAGLNPTSYTASDNFALYFVDDAHAVMIETDSTQLALGVFELQQ